MNYRYALASALALLTIATGASAQCPGGVCYRQPNYAALYAPAPVAYQLADASGKAWQHADASYLATWVAEHNKTLATAKPAKPTNEHRIGGLRIPPEILDELHRTQANSQPKAKPASSQAAPAIASDPTGFLPWLNAYRARFYRNPVVIDPALSADAAASNAAMRRFGFGHHFRYAPDQKCVGMGSLAAIEAMWQADAPHNDWLLKPGITAIGIAYDGQYATYSAR